MFCVLVVLLGLCVHSSTAALGSRVSWNLLLRNIIICSPGDTSSKRLHIPPSKTEKNISEPYDASHISQIIFSRNIFDNYFGPRQPKYLSKIFLVRNGLMEVIWMQNCNMGTTRALYSQHSDLLIDRLTEDLRYCKSFRCICITNQGCTMYVTPNFGHVLPVITHEKHIFGFVTAVTARKKHEGIHVVCHLLPQGALFPPLYRGESRVGKQYNTIQYNIILGGFQ